MFVKVEVKPYVLDDQLCDECQGGRCGGKFAPFFCANVTCLQVEPATCLQSIVIIDFLYFSTIVNNVGPPSTVDQEESFTNLWSRRELTDPELSHSAGVEHQPIRARYFTEQRIRGQEIETNHKSLVKML